MPVKEIDQFFSKDPGVPEFRSAYLANYIFFNIVAVSSLLNAVHSYIIPTLFAFISPFCYNRIMYGTIYELYL